MKIEWKQNEHQKSTTSISNECSEFSNNNKCSSSRLPALLFLISLWHIGQFKNRMIHNKSYIIIPYFCLARSSLDSKELDTINLQQRFSTFSFFCLNSLNAWIFSTAHALCPISTTFHSKWKKERIPKIFAMTSSAQCKRRMNTAKHRCWLGAQLAHGILLESSDEFSRKITHTETCGWKMCADIWKRDEPMCSTTTLRTWIAYSQTTILSVCWLLFDEFYLFFFRVRSLPFLHCKWFGLHISRLLHLFCLELWAHSHSESGVLWAVQLCVVVAFTFRSKSENPIKWI